MSIVDERGRIFGRINVIDGAVVAFLLALLPIGYGTYLLFRPAAPRIDSVTQVDLNREEYRIADGATIAVKLKVRGSGLNPLLRARIGGQDALAFVFENPNSADVVVGEMAPGTYDLVLYDGVQEAARANGAVKIQQSSNTRLRLVGRFMNLTEAQVKTMRPGFKTADGARGAFEIIAIGAAAPGHQHISAGETGVDLRIAGAVEHPAVLNVACDHDGATCSVGGISIGARLPVTVVLDSGVAFAVDEVLPNTEPTRARIQVRLTGPQTASMKEGDRDLLLDARAAVIRSIDARDANSVTATLELGADSSREGWSYRGRHIRPGATFRFVTDRYESEGIIARTDVETPAPRPAP